MSDSAASSSTSARSAAVIRSGQGSPAGGLVGAGDVGDEDVDHRVVGLEEAVLLVVEHFVEGLERDPGDLDHVGDGRRLVALCRRDADHRLAQALPLGADGVGLGQPVTSHSGWRENPSGPA